MRVAVFAFMVLVGLLLIAVTPAFSHHSFMSEYDINKPITVQAYAAKKQTPVAATRTVILANGQKLNADADGVRVPD